MSCINTSQIVDRASGEKLSDLLSKVNHVYIQPHDYLSVPLNQRRKGIVVTFLGDGLETRQYDSVDVSDVEFNKPANWKKMTSEKVVVDNDVRVRLSALEQVVESVKMVKSAPQPSCITNIYKKGNELVVVSNNAAYNHTIELPVPAVGSNEALESRILALEHLKDNDHVYTAGDHIVIEDGRISLSNVFYAEIMGVVKDLSTSLKNLSVESEKQAERIKALEAQKEKKNGDIIEVLPNGEVLPGKKEDPKNSNNDEQCGCKLPDQIKYWFISEGGDVVKGTYDMEKEVSIPVTVQGKYKVKFSVPKKYEIESIALYGGDNNIRAYEVKEEAGYRTYTFVGSGSGLLNLDTDLTFDILTSKI